MLKILQKVLLLFLKETKNENNTLRTLIEDKIIKSIWRHFNTEVKVKII